MTFGERLKSARVNATMTQGQLANALNTTSNSISNWEKGISKPYADMLSELCKILNIDSNWLLGWESDKLSPAAQRIARLYDKADDHTREIVKLALKPFDDNETARPVEFHHVENIITVAATGEGVKIHKLTPEQNEAAKKSGAELRERLKKEKGE